MEVSNIETWVKDGFRVGGHVWLDRRITIKYGPSDKHRKDMGPGTKAAIKGFLGTDHVVVLFDVDEPKAKVDVVEWKVHKSNCLLQDPNEPDNTGTGGAASGSVVPMFKKYPFLEQPEELVPKEVQVYSD
eukprot:10718736-Karenia_brevis.AAC.1